MDGIDRRGTLASSQHPHIQTVPVMIGDDIFRDKINITFPTVHVQSQIDMNYIANNIVDIIPSGKVVTPEKRILLSRGNIGPSLNLSSPLLSSAGPASQ